MECHTSNCSNQITLQVQFVVPSSTLNTHVPNAIDSCDAFLVNTEVEHDHFDTISSLSSFRKLFLVYRYVLIFINNLKRKIKTRFPDKYANIDILDANHNFFAEARSVILKQEQKVYYPDVLRYFHSREKLLRDMPKIVGQLNVYQDGEGLL